MALISTCCWELIKPMGFLVASHYHTCSYWRLQNTWVIVLLFKLLLDQFRLCLGLVSCFPVCQHVVQIWTSYIFAHWLKEKFSILLKMLSMKQRFIVAARSTSLIQVSKWLGSLYTAILPVVDDLWLANWSWCLQWESLGSYRLLGRLIEVIKLLNHSWTNKSPPLLLQSFDFLSLYTKINPSRFES